MPLPGVASKSNRLRLGAVVAVATIFSWPTICDTAEPPVKRDDPPPVIPRSDSDAAGAQPAPAPANVLPSGGAAQPLPDDLPALLDPTKPGVPSTPRRRVPVLEPLPEGEEAATDEFIPMEERIIEETVAQPEFDVANYAIENPIARTALTNIFGIAETFYDSFGRIPDPRTVAILPRGAIEEARGFRLGPMSLRPVLSSSVIAYYDRVGAEKRRDEQVVSGFMSGVMGEKETGRYLTLDYGASHVFGADTDDDSKIDQSLFLSGHLLIGKLKLGIGIDFANLSGYSRDVGAETQRDFLTIALTSSYQITPRISFDWDLAMPDGRYPGGGSTAAGIGDSSGFTSTNFINYEYSPKTQLGLGFSTGYVEVEDAERQTFQQVLGRLTSAPTPFLNYSASVGVEFRDTGFRSTTNPIFILGAYWTPRERTAISLVAEQRVQNSAASTDENFLTSSVILTFSQQLGNRMHLSLAAGFEHAKYESVGTVDSSDREDRTYFGQMALSARVTDRFNVAATISYTKTESNVSPAEIAQFALHASFAF